MLGTIFFVLLAIFVISASTASFDDDSSEEGASFWSYAIILFLFVILPFWLAVWRPAHKVTFKETYQEYREAQMLADYASSRDSWQINDEERSVIIAVIDRYNDHADRLRENYDNIWYGMYVDDDSVKLPTIGIPNKLQN